MPAILLAATRWEQWCLKLKSLLKKTSQIKNLTPGGKLRHPIVWVRDWTLKQEQPVKSRCQSKSLEGQDPDIPEDALDTAQMCPRPPRGSSYLKSPTPLTG